MEQKTIQQQIDALQKRIEYLEGGPSVIRVGDVWHRRDDPTILGRVGELYNPNDTKSYFRDRVDVHGLESQWKGCMCVIFRYEGSHKMPVEDFYATWARHTPSI